MTAKYTRPATSNFEVVGTILGLTFVCPTKRMNWTKETELKGKGQVFRRCSTEIFASLRVFRRSLCELETLQISFHGEINDGLTEESRGEDGPVKRRW